MPGLGRLAIVSRTRLRSSLLGNNYLHRSPDLTLAEQEPFVPAQVRCVSGQNEGGETAGLVDSIGGVISLDRWAGILGTTELLGCVLAGMASAERTDPPLPATGYVCLGIASFAFIWLVQARLLRLYTRATLVAGVRENLQRGLLAGVLTVGQLSLLSLLSESAGLVSRDWFVSWGLGVLATVATVRLLWSVFLGRALSRGGCLERAIVLAGSAEAAAELTDLIRQESGGRIGVLFSIAIQDIDDPAAVSLLEHAIRDEKCHRVIIGGFERVPAGLRSLTDRLALVAVDITVIPNLAGFGGSIKRMDRIGSLPAIGVASHPLTPLQAFLKRTEDLVIATVALIVFAPVLVLISIAVKLDSRGPVLFTQHREGFNGRVFELFKFRTMYSDMADPAASRQTSRGDPRVTRFGSLLRRTSLDELPQLINVLRGEMSIVGPRPHALGMTTLGVRLQELLATYGARHRLRPGITGWAQVRNCRGEINTQEKLRNRVFLDCDYIDRWSLALDFWIILNTIWLMINDHDAY